MRFNIRRQLKKIQSYLMHKSFIRRMIAWKGLYNYAVHGSNDIKNIIRMYALTHYNQDYRDALTASLAKSPTSKAIIDARTPIPTGIDFFKEYPENTLGGAYYAHLVRNKINPVQFREISFKRADEYTYIILRVMSTHDIYHVLLGQDTDLIGEGIVASFTIAQLPAYLPPAVHLSAGFLRTVLTKHNNVDDDISAIALGSITGHRAVQLFDVEWESLWAEDVDAVRHQLAIDIEESKELLKSMRKYDHDI